MNVSFYGYDSFKRAVFKGADGLFYGDTGLKKAKDVEPKDLEYFGTHFDCEPHGGAPKVEITKALFKRVRVLLPIKPKYAAQIMKGEKKQ